MVKAVFFDLFFTLILPKRTEENEYDVLNISLAEWDTYAQNRRLYRERALGYIKEDKDIIEEITAIMPYEVTEEQKSKMLYRRRKRTKNALLNVDEEILDTLEKIHQKNIKLCLISNADVLDCKYWQESKLAEIFDEAIFSCNVSMVKPAVEIYQYAMDKIGVAPEDSIFVGDGGDDELMGAKTAGMKTVFTEFLTKKNEELRSRIKCFADYDIERFNDLLDIV